MTVQLRPKPTDQCQFHASEIKSGVTTCDIGRVDGTVAGQRQQQRSTDAEEIGKRQRPQLQRQRDGGLTDLVGEE